jgi:hypothetical protein
LKTVATPEKTSSKRHKSDSLRLNAQAVAPVKPSLDFESHCGFFPTVHSVVLGHYGRLTVSFPRRYGHLAAA